LRSTKWSSDYELEPGEWFGEWLYKEIAANVHIEQHGFMPDRVREAAERLQRDRRPDERYVAIVPWLDAFNAFTAPGKYVYFGRRLLERCPHEDAAAFVIAHEIAHHDLGHLEVFAGQFSRHATRLTAGVLIVLFFRMLQKRIYSPEWEPAVDRRAIDLCLEAGYDPGKCLYLFHILELIYLDYGDFGAVYGLDPESDEELSPEASVVTKARIWLYQRRRGYLPIQDRVAEVQRYIEAAHGLRNVRPRKA
jgi:predicted Zn-dependent protease